MGLVYADITMSNPREPGLKPVETRALADTGAVRMCIPSEVAMQLKLEVSEQRGVVLADGTVKQLPYAGPLQVHFGGRSSFTGALIGGDEVLLGAIPMEDMDLVVSPLMRTVTVNPKHPNIPVVLLKSAANREGNTIN